MAATEKCRCRSAGAEPRSTLITLLLVLLAVAAIIPFVFAARSAVARSESIEQLESRLHSVDLEAFLNLTSSRDLDFLQSQLAPSSFRRVNRLRIRATLKYLKSLSWNSAVLMKIGELAGRSPDPVIADSGRELAQIALRTRMLALRAYWKLAPQFILPGHDGVADVHLMSNYTELREHFGRLVSIQRP
jgi:MYXO-CTERM domain-containing protein